MHASTSYQNIANGSCSFSPNEHRAHWLTINCIIINWSRFS